MSSLGGNTQDKQLQENLVEYSYLPIDGSSMKLIYLI
jgi:hypothetical protein